MSIKAADVVFHCAFREVAAVKVSPSAAGISPQATACLRSIKCKGKQLICLTGPIKALSGVMAHEVQKAMFD